MLKEALDGLKSLLAYLQRERHALGEKHDAALFALYAAANETMLYIQRSNSRHVDRKAEEDLSRLWTKAAVYIRHIDPKLADKCLIKGNYWVNPKSSEWTAENIEKTGIGIAEIFEQARTLIGQRS